MVQPILNYFTVLETVIQWLQFLFCNLLDIFAAWPRKWGSSGPTVVYALHKLLILICSETANASSVKIYHDIVLDSLYIPPRNDEVQTRVHLGPCSGGDFAITVQLILKKFTVLETVIEGLHLLLCNL